MQSGDTLFTIEQNLLGNGNLDTEITNADGKAVNAATLQPGQVVYVPSSASSTPAPTAAPTPAPAASSSSRSACTVQSGDTLFSIAQTLLSNGNLDTEITNADGSAVNPATLQPGQVVYVPASGSAAPAPGSSFAGSGASGFANLVSQQMFSKIFPNASAVYTYEGLVAATRAYHRFVTLAHSSRTSRKQQLSWPTFRMSRARWCLLQR